MDNDREINPKPIDAAGSTDLVENTKAYFLQVAMEEFKTAQERYNLNDEFVKTRRNRNFLVLGVVAATVVLFGVFALLLNSYLEAKNNQVSISAKEFDDINLRDLLDQAKRLEGDISLVQAQLDSIAASAAQASQKARSESSDQLALFKSTNPAPEELQRKTEALERGLAARIKGIEDGAAAARQPMAAQLASLRTQLAGIDQRKLEVAKKQEVVLNNERRVYDVERQRIQTLLEDQLKQQKADYEGQLQRRENFIRELGASAQATLVREQERLKLLYNPILADDLSRYLLASPIDSQRLGHYSLSLPEAYQKSGIIAGKRIDLVNQTLGDYASLLRILRQVPYTNSVPDVLAQLQYRTLVAVDATTSIFDDFWKALKEREAIIAERERTIKERDATIADQAATIQENQATLASQAADLKDRDAKIVQLQRDMQSQSAQDQAAYAALLASYDSYAQANGLDGVILDAKSPAALVAYLRPAEGMGTGSRFYILRGAGELLEEAELGEAGTLSKLAVVAVSARTKPVAKNGGPALPKLSFIAKPPASLDWLVRVENYPAWKSAQAKSGAR